jgi:hypothetical protein
MELEASEVLSKFGLSSHVLRIGSWVSRIDEKIENPWNPHNPHMFMIFHVYSSGFSYEKTINNVFSCRLLP